MQKVNPRSTKTLRLMRPSLPSTGSRKRLPVLKLLGLCQWCAEECVSPIHTTPERLRAPGGGPGPTASLTFRGFKGFLDANWEGAGFPVT